MRLAVLCLLLAASCSHTPNRDSGSATLGCRYRDVDFCLLVTPMSEAAARPPASGGSAISRATQVKLDADVILRGMNQ
jgi:hypothetical protein